MTGELSIQDNHIHLVVEAHDKSALSRGMQSLDARVARNLNRTLAAHGNVWRERYHARELTTPRSVRNAIVYVLMNAKKHGYRFASGLDALSSAAWFDGFAHRDACADESPVMAPRTWLAGVGWRRRGLIRPEERPSSPH